MRTSNVFIDWMEMKQGDGISWSRRRENIQNRNRIRPNKKCLTIANNQSTAAGALKFVYRLIHRLKQTHIPHSNHKNAKLQCNRSKCVWYRHIYYYVYFLSTTYKWDSIFGTLNCYDLSLDEWFNIQRPAVQT